MNAPTNRPDTFDTHHAADAGDPAPAGHQSPASAAVSDVIGADSTGPRSEGLPVTPLAHFTSIGDCQFLACGIDTLYLGVSVTWGTSWSEFSRQLDDAKERASGTEGVLSPTGDYLILPKGKGANYRWHLVWPEFHLYLARNQIPQGKTPNVYICLLSRTLWSMPIPAAVQLACERIAALGGLIQSVKPSRCDLAADFLIPNGLSLDFLLDHAVPDDGKNFPVMTGKQMETFGRGAKKSPIQLRIYDKGKEIRVGGTKFWFLDIWQLPSEHGVWRAEFQLRRSVLRQFAIQTMDDLLTKRGALWEYLTTKWFSLRLHDDSNTSRRTTHPWWSLVQALAEKFGALVPIQRTFRGSGAITDWYVKQGAGFLASYAARAGIPDLETAAVHYLADIEDHWMNRRFDEAVMIRRLKLGLPPIPELFDEPPSENRAA